MTKQQSKPFEPMTLQLLTLQARVTAAREAISRARLGFLVTTVLSLTVLVTLYNSYVSWYRGFALQDSFAENEVTKQAQVFLLEEWVKNQTIAIHPLGLRVGVSDASFLASTSLFISTLWFFFCVRRENHVVGLLLADTDKEEDDVKSYVYHGVSSHMIFLDSTGSDFPIPSLDPPEPPKRGLPLVRASVKTLYFLPGATIAACVIFDVLTIFVLKAAFRYPHTPLFQHMTLDNTAWILIIEVIAIILGTLAFKMSLRMLAFQNSTEDRLREYSALIPRIS